MISKDEYDAYRSASQIIAQLRKLIPQLIHEDAQVREICEKIEMETFKLGGRPAFPCNIGINEVAAHYTPPWEDNGVIPRESVVKIDFGVHVDGYLIDTAVTISLSPLYDAMVDVAKAALSAGVRRIAHGVKFSEIGNEIERTINQYGFKPIRNLTGHKIERYTIHAGKSVPNVAGPAQGRFEEGDVYAIEPFVTTREAAGRVEDSDQTFIYRMVKERGVRTETAKKVVEHARATYRSLPFASRWLYASLDKELVDRGFAEAVKARCIMGYPVLVEASGSVVTQAEHTVVVRQNDCEILTD